jgi:hypothetical protein
MEAKREVFLAAYAKYGSIILAAKTAGVGRDRHYSWLRDPNYKIAFARAHKRAAAAILSRLEEMAASPIEAPRVGA